MSKTDTTAKSKNSMATFFKVLRFIGKYRFLLVLSVILAAVTVILQLYVPVLFGYAIDEVVAAHEVDFTRMGFYLSRILVMIVFSGIATWIMSVINNRMTYRTVQDIRARSIRHIQKLPLSYLDGHSTGDIISRVIADTDILSDGMLLGFTQLFSGIITIIGTHALHVLQKCVDHSDDHCPDTCKLFCGEIHLLPFLPDVPCAE